MSQHAGKARLTTQQVAAIERQCPPEIKLAVSALLPHWRGSIRPKDRAFGGELRGLARRAGLSHREADGWSDGAEAADLVTRWTRWALKLLPVTAGDGLDGLRHRIAEVEQALSELSDATRVSSPPPGAPATRRPTRRPTSEALQPPQGAAPVRRRQPRLVPKVRVHTGPLPPRVGELKVFGAQRPGRPLNGDVPEVAHPSRPVGWSQSATWTGGE